MSIESREERKANLRDWMTAQTQLTKAKNHTLTMGDLSYLWRHEFGIRMSEKWVRKALNVKEK
jgi:transposase